MTGVKTSINATNTLIKWPGGKSREIQYFERLIPAYDRYIEPFFGGGAMFFHLKPKSALINDISSNLMDFYSLVKEQNITFRETLTAYSVLIRDLLKACDENSDELLRIYCDVKEGSSESASLNRFVDTVCAKLDQLSVKRLIPALKAYKNQLGFCAKDKMLRTVRNEEKAPFSIADLRENLITGFMSGTYMYFRDIYNDILLKRKPSVTREYRIANFYFIREYCYGSMFRYNSNGEFNIPYGGMSYNRKDLKAKIDEMFCKETKELFSNTDIHCQDFEAFLSTVSLTENDFMFLDPPYDTDFSDYEGKDFTREDQKRLAESLKKTKAKFILIIKNTDFIYALYEHDFHTLCFDKTYTYNVRSRNDRNAEHLIITNLPIE